MTLFAQALDAAWNPLNQQSIEPDTTFLLDPDGDSAAGFSPGFGGLCPQSSDDPGPFPAIVAGKFRKGIQPSHATSTLTLSLAGIVPASEFTIECWAQCTTVDWSAIGSTVILTVSGGTQFMHVWVGNPTKVEITHTQNPASTSGYTGSASVVPTNGQYPVSTWVSVAATLLGGALTLYLNGIQVARITGVIAPAIWSADDGYKHALQIGGPSFIISDLRVSRKARVPGQALIAPNRSTVSVSSSTTGATVQKLNGTLHALANTQANGIQAGMGGLSVVRTDKLLSCTPIVAGGTDATHPTAGHSGSYSYDWQVVDRSLHYISETLGCEPYISLDSAPQILGGLGVAPYGNTPKTTSGAQAPDVSGTLLLTSGTGLPANSGFSYSGNIYAYVSISGNTLTGVTFVSGLPGLVIPNGATVNVGPLTSFMAYQGAFAGGSVSAGNTAAFATMCADLVYHILSELTLTHPPVYFGLWNEPDGSSFWETGVNAIPDYLTLYNAVIPAVKAVAPAAKVGGPEISGITSHTSWVTQLISNCKTNSIALDFVSCHFYSSDMSDLAQLAALVTAECAAVGMTPVPSLINGESAYFYSIFGSWPFFQPWIAQGPPSGYTQTGAIQANFNDYQAGWLAAFLIQQQQQGFVRGIYNEPNAAGATVPSALFDANGVPQVGYNVMRLWAMTVGNSVLGTTVTSDPGVFAVASKDGGGKVYVFLASVRERKTQDYPVLIPVAGVTDSTNVTAYVVDDHHSNPYDAQTPGGILETVSVPAIKGGNAAIQLRPRSAALLVIG